MKKSIIKILLFSFLITGCGNVTSSTESISSNISSNSNEVSSTSVVEANDLELLSFKIADEKRETKFTPQRKNDDVEVDEQHAILNPDNTDFHVEAIVKNEKRLSFIDMVLYISFLQKYVVFNEGNGKYVCATETALENNIWVTKIYMDIHAETEIFVNGYVEINEINFLDLNSKKVQTDINKVKSKKVTYHCHHSYEVIDSLVANCIAEGYTKYECDECHEEYKVGVQPINPNNHVGNRFACEYCGYKESGYKYSDGNKVIENMTFNSDKGTYKLDSLLEEYDKVVLFFFDNSTMGSVQFEKIIKPIYEKCKDDVMLIGVGHHEESLNDVKGIVDIPMVYDYNYEIEHSFNFGYYYLFSVSIDKNKIVKIADFEKLGFYEYMKYYIAFAELCGLDFDEFEKALCSINIELLKAKFIIDEENILEVNDSNQLRFYTETNGEKIQIGPTYYYSEKVEDKLMFRDSSNNKLYISYLEGTTDSLVIEKDEIIYAYEYYSYNLKKIFEKENILIEEIKVSSSDDYYYTMLWDGKCVRSYRIESKENPRLGGTVFQFLKPLDVMKNHFTSDYENPEYNNEALYNMYSYYGNIYGNILFSYSSDGTTERDEFNAKVQNIISAASKNEFLPVDAQEFLNVCTPIEGQSTIEYLVSYMNVKGYSYLNKETEYMDWDNYRDYTTDVEELISTYSTDEYKEVLGNIVDCYVFHKNIDGYECYCMVLVTDKMISGNYLVTGVNIVTEIGYLNVIFDTYCAIEAWKSCQDK